MFNQITKPTQKLTDTLLHRMVKEYCIIVGTNCRRDKYQNLNISIFAYPIKKKIWTLCVAAE